MRDTNRRAFLRECLAGAAWLASSGCAGNHAPPVVRGARLPPAGPKSGGPLPFVHEDDLPLEQPFGRGLDGRLFTNLSTLTAETMVIPTERFFVRTRSSELLQNPSDWQIRVVGLVKRRQIITLPALQPHVRPAGTHVMECSGNASGGHFGLLSAAEWSGVPLGRIIPSLGPLPAARRVLISGFDEYPQPSRHRSVPGAGWIFTPEQLRSTGAFLATKMNGQPLTPDHGAPVRLIVPGWYGCTCIKWVDRIELVADDAPATSQMLEFAARTHQEGVPELARDYLPAALEQAAMALRVDPVQGRRSPTFRITGVTWGGKCVTQGLQIRFRADEEYRPVAPAAAPKQPTSWALWTYDWQPTGAGLYAIQLRIDPPKVPQRRLDAGYYTRYVEL